MVSSISSKKQTKTCRIVVKTNSFVRDLEEFTAWQFAFEINWPIVLKNVHSISYKISPSSIVLTKFKSFFWLYRNILRRLLYQWIRFVASRDDYERMENLRRHFQAQVALEIPDYSPLSSLTWKNQIKQIWSSLIKFEQVWTSFI